MSRILIWRQIISGSDIDIFGKSDYSQLINNIKRLYGGSCPNWGNKLWFQGICSEIDRPENEITFRTNESIEEINDKFDLIIWPMANFFSEKYAANTEEHVKTLKQIKIPVYIIACGVQASNYDDLDNLIKKIGKSSCDFIDAVYKTGGEFALRGYFTKEFFNLLGYNTAVVTGCPSMYQLGRNFHASEEKIDHDKIKPVITGKISLFENIMKKIPDSVYLSQEMYADCLYNPEYFGTRSLKKDINFYANYSIFQASLLASGRIKMICDTNDWYHYFKDNRINFAFGTKIHGSIMPILAGVPALLVATDSRTTEMAEFFDIPFISSEKAKVFTMKEYYEAYDFMDYSKFNESYKKRFDFFEQFLINHKIVSRINGDNKFFLAKGGKDYDLFQPNKEQFMKYAGKLGIEELLLKTGLQLKKIIEYKR